MKNLWKYITGFFSFIIGILVLSNKKNKKLNEIKGKIKDVNKDIKRAKDKGGVLQKSLKSKKQALKEIEAQKFKKKDIGAKEAKAFLKGFSKGKK